MASRKSKSNQMVEELKGQLVEYFRESVLDDYDYDGLTGSDLYEALIETFKELQGEIEEKLKPLQFVLNKLEPQQTEFW